MTTKKKLKEKVSGNFVQDERVKIDVRLSPEADRRVEKLANRIGTTKNSIVVVATTTFCSVMERAAGAGEKPLAPKEVHDIVEKGLTELLAR